MPLLYRLFRASKLFIKRIICAHDRGIWSSPSNPSNTANNSYSDLGLVPLAFRTAPPAVLRRGQMEAISTQRAKCFSLAGKFRCFSLLCKLSGGQKELATSADQRWHQDGATGKTPQEEADTSIRSLLLKNVSYDEHLENMNEMRKKRITHKSIAHR